MSNNSTDSSTSSYQQRQQQQQFSTGSQQQQQQERQRRLKEIDLEQQQLRAQIALQNYAALYPIQITWPAQIIGVTRTSKDLLQHRLLEHGIFYDNDPDSATAITTNTTDIAKNCTKIIADLQRTDCFDAIQIQIGTPAPGTTNSSNNDDDAVENDNDNSHSSSNRRTIQVKVHEKKWYTLYAGAGSKEIGFGSTSSGLDDSSIGSSNSSNSSSSNNITSSSFLPVAEINVAAGLRNTTGHLDKTELRYTIDTKSLSSLSIGHSRPLYSTLPESLRDIILTQTNGSQYEVSIKGVLDTIDHEYVRGYKEYQRYISCHLCNEHNVNHSPVTALVQTRKNWYTHLEWLCLYRDIIPRRHSSTNLSPYHFDASKSTISFAGPSIKNSFNAVIQYNSPDIVNDDDDTTSDISINNPLLPTKGYQFYSSIEVATPPGDVGFIKGQVSSTKHWLVSPNVSIHANASSGYMYPLTFGGLFTTYSSNSNKLVHPSDRFYIGGTNSFRGFVPGGIGPRGYVNGGASSSTSTSNTPTTRTGLGGNALGGDFYYTSTLMISSVALDTVPILSQYLSNLGVRLFCYTTVGTCCSINNRRLQSSSSSSSPYSLLSSARIRLLRDIVQSSRVSTGIGMTTTAFGPKLEVSYSIPIRFSPMDGRKSFQFGMSFSV
jgi:Omp85 superfamily domain